MIVFRFEELFSIFDKTNVSDYHGLLKKSEQFCRRKLLVLTVTIKKLFDFGFVSF